MKSNTRRLVRRCASNALDSLESRRLMAASAVDMPPDLVDRIDSHLWDAVALAGQHRVGTTPANLQNRAQFAADGSVQTYIRVDAKLDTVLAKLGQFDVRIEGSNQDMRVIQAWIAPDQLDDVARLDGVSRIDIPDYAIKNVITAGDGILNADKVRNRFLANGIDGSGVKIGVISDGANHRANVGGELPSVTVNPSIPGTGDEGTAMLEIVHDLAPGAQLYFCGPNTSLQMVNSINYLVSQGCNVIVDDLGFLGEGYFTDTTIAQAAQSAVNAGVVYVTSAGNFGNAQHYQANYAQGLSAFGGGILHRFGVAGQDTNQVNIPANTTFRAFLEWSDGWGTSANDYDMYLYNGDTIAQLDSSTTVQNGNDLPFEAVQWTNNTASTVHAQIWIVRKSGAAVRELELFTIGNSTMQFSTQADALFGHEAVADVISVAAASAASPTNVEAFSSRGGSTIYSNFTTQTKATRTTLDGTAIDGVQTAVGAAGFFYNPFYGTSAAAPHAAAIAALVRDANPSLTPAQVAQIMADTALDLGVAGYDTISGAGRYDALAAVYKAYTPSTLDMSASSDTGASNSDNITGVTNPVVSATVPAGSGVTLFVDGIAKLTSQMGAGLTNYSVFVPAMSEGVHQITIRVVESGGATGANASLPSAPLTVTIDNTAPTISIPMAFNVDSPAQSLTMTFSEDVSGNFDVNSLMITSPTLGAVPNANKQVSFVGNTMTMSFPGYANGILPDGNYTATFAPGTPNDAAGNAVVGTSPYSFLFLQGDMTRDGVVDFSDLLLLAQNYGTTGKVFTTGNLDYDAAGNVEFNDLLILAQRYGTSLFSSAPIVAGTSRRTSRAVNEMATIL